MKILIIEATAEELAANRTVMDSVNDVLNRFTDTLFGINNIDYTKVFDKEAPEESCVEHDGCVGCDHEYTPGDKEPCASCKQNYHDRYRYSTAERLKEQKNE